MKRLFALLLCLATLLTMVACGSSLEEAGTQTAQTGEGDGTTTTTKTPTVTQNITYPKIANPLTWDDINAIPIAKQGMSEDQLRQICIDFMQLQLSFLWTPNKSVNYYSYGDHAESVKIRVIYGGMPYVSNTTNNLYMLMNYYDSETGIMDTESMGKNAPEIFGNQCSGNTFWGWARVSNTMNWGGTNGITPAQGAVLVGPYTYDTERIKNFHSSSINTVDICQENGEQVMFQSYANTKKADGVVRYEAAVGGHVMMITDIHVEKAADGTIDGKKSYLAIQDQAPARTPVTVDGKTVLMQIGHGRNFTFEQLIKDGYLPFTLKELIGQDPIEPGSITLSHTDSTITYDQLHSAKVKASYAISHVNVTFTNAQGEEVFSRVLYLRAGNAYQKEVLFSGLGLLRAPLEKAVSDGDTITITAQIGNGEVLDMYQGTFKK